MLNPTTLDPTTIAIQFIHCEGTSWYFPYESWNKIHMGTRLSYKRAWWYLKTRETVIKSSTVQSLAPINPQFRSCVHSHSTYICWFLQQTTQKHSHTSCHRKFHACLDKAIGWLIWVGSRFSWMIVWSLGSCVCVIHIIEHTWINFITVSIVASSLDLLRQRKTHYFI